jgi:hypothetical protein
MIVTAKPPRRISSQKQSRSKEAAVVAKSARVVSVTRPRKYKEPEELPPDAEADARVQAFLQRMIQPRSD